MYNRHLHEKFQEIFEKQIRKDAQLRKFVQKRKVQKTVKTQLYKERVRDFLVKMASKPLELGQYIPPVSNIVRDNNQALNIASPVFFINGFKTNKQRLQRAASQNKILDNTPTAKSPLNHEYRSRLFDKQIQPGMRFQGIASPKSNKMPSSSSVPKLPSIISNPETKMHFKGIEQMGNKLKSMQQRQSDRIGLINKLQTVYGDSQINLQQASLQILRHCKLNKSKTLKTIKSTCLSTQRQV